MAGIRPAHRVKWNIVQQVTGRGVKTGPNLALLLEILKAQSLATPKRVWDLRRKAVRSRRSS